MRQLICKIMTVVLILNLMVSMSAAARQEAMLYIDGDTAGVPVTENGGALMLAISELSRLSLSYSYIEDGIAVTDGRKTLKLYMESSVVFAGEEAEAYDNSLYAVDGQVQAVNVRLLCDAFGFGFTETDIGATVTTQMGAPAVLAATSGMVSGQIVMPDGKQAQAEVSATVMLRSAVFPYSPVASAAIRIPAGQSAAAFSLTLPETEGGVWLTYQLYSEYDGIYRSGYYSDTGTSIDRTTAKVFSGGVSGLRFTLVPTKEVRATVILPTGRTAEEDIKGTVYILPNISMGTESNYVSSENTVVIRKACHRGEAVFDLPVQDSVQYKLGLRYLTGDSAIYSTAYYKNSGGTVSKQKATLVGSDCGDITILLLENRTIAGWVDNAKSACEVIAIAQDDPEKRKGINESVFYTKAYSSDTMGAFSLCVPDEFTDYILAVKYIADDMSSLRYYTEHGLSANVEDASVVYAGTDVYDIVIDKLSEYSGTKINLLGHTLEQDNAFCVGYENVSTVAQNGLSAFAAYYDASGRMLGVSKVQKDIAVGEVGTLRFSTESIAGRTVAKVKVFVWDNAFQPVSKVKEIDWSIDTDRYKGLYVSGQKISAADATNFFYACQTAFVTKELAARVLKANIAVSGDTVTITRGSDTVVMTKNSPIVFVNGKRMVNSSGMPMQYGQTIALPLYVLLDYFGMQGYYYNKTTHDLYIL